MSETTSTALAAPPGTIGTAIGRSGGVPDDPAGTDIEALRDELEFYRDVFRCLPVGLVVIDDEDRIALTNPMGEEIRRVGERNGRPLAECHPPRTQHALRSVMARLRDLPPHECHPLVVERGNRWEVHYSRITSPEGAYRGAAWIALDIGRQKELQRKLLHQERVAGLGRMAGRLAHDVKNALNVVSGALHYLRGMATDDAVATEMVGIIDAQVERLTRLIDHLRQATRPLDVRREPCDVAEVARQAVRDCRCQHPSTTIELVLPAALPVVHVDGGLLGRLLDNALDNAARAGATNITVCAIHDTRDKGEWLVIDVDDNGPGFPQEVLDHLFEPFVTTRADGNGLGLVMMREVCLLHGGDLEIHPRESGGTRVRARLLSR